MGIRRGVERKEGVSQEERKRQVFFLRFIRKNILLSDNAKNRHLRPSPSSSPYRFRKEDATLSGGAAWWEEREVGATVGPSYIFMTFTTENFLILN